MTRGRHRHHLTPKTVLPPVTIGALATAGVVLAVVNGNLQVLRLAVVASWLIALSAIGWSWNRNRTYTRTLALQESTRRREESLFSEQLTSLQATLTLMQQQLGVLTTESVDLRREVMELRADKAEVEETLRAARAERARQRNADQELADQRLLTVAAFEAAATVLDALDASAMGEDQDWVTAWVASLGDSELDLTMHDDTIPLDLDMEVPVGNTA
jgi:hypothetical protein